MDADAPVYNHLVISGGGIAGICLYKTLRDTNLRGEWCADNIKSIHAVSAGTICAIICALIRAGHYDWAAIDNYIIHRPLHRLFSRSTFSLTEFFYNCGFIDRAIFDDFLRPIFGGADMEIEITMREFYERTGVELFFYCTELFSFSKVVMSGATTPDLPVIDAIYRSCTIPFIMRPQRGIRRAEGASSVPPNLPGFQPQSQNGNSAEGSVSPPNSEGRSPSELYIDGYLKTNFPSQDAIDYVCQEAGEEGATKKILGFRLKTPRRDVNNMIDLAKSIIFAIGNAGLRPLPHEHVIENTFETIDDIYLFFKCSSRRREIIQPLPH